MAQGRRAALLSTVGICIGYLIYTVLAALGLSAVLQSSAIAFDIVRYLGAAYLVYLGIRALLSKRGGPLTQGAVKPLPARRILQQGILTSMLNPKGILVFAALLRKQHGTCRWCGLLFQDTDVIEIDHFTPKSAGGGEELEQQVSVASPLL
ncbi:MAG: LysE family transporter [Ktedonobacterales bacterium]